MTTNPDDPQGPATPHRKGRLTKSRAIAAGASVGALVLVTAGIAAANPAKDSSNGSKDGSTDANRRNAGATNRGDDSGWYGGGSLSSSGQDLDGDGRIGDPGDQGFSRGGDDDGWGRSSDDGGGFQQAPSDGFSDGGGFQQAPSNSFDPGFGGGGGHSSSGGS